MSVLPVEAPTGRLARRNAVAKLVATAVPALVLMVSLDLVTPAIIIVATLLALPLGAAGPARAGAAHAFRRCTAS